MNIKPAIRRKTAFTIVEVIMSVCILTIGAAALMCSFRYAFFIMRMARENQRATQIMLERAEAVRCFSWDNLIVGTNVPPTFSETYDPTKPEGAQGAVYNGRVSVDPFTPTSGNPSYSTNMRQLKITLTWATSGVTRHRTNITYVAKDGVQNYVY